VLPLAGPADEDPSARLRRGVDQVIASNNRLTVYIELKKRLSTLNLAGLWTQ
jgi:hypothetical protein